MDVTEQRLNEDSVTIKILNRTLWDRNKTLNLYDPKHYDVQIRNFDIKSIFANKIMSI